MASVFSLKLKQAITELVRTYREAYRLSMLRELPDMTFRQFVYLDAILKMNNPTYTEVAKEFNVTKPAVTAIVNKLIGLGYLKRIQSQEDRRIYYLMVSDKGKQVLEVENKTAAEYVLSVESCLTQNEQQQFITIVEKIIANHPAKRP